MAELTPMMQKYTETKAQYPDCILFYRLGDFYEMFFEDAKVVSKELELTLTGKSCGLEERAPMCGVPYHAVETYLSKLVNKGYKVAICDQVEDPKLAKGLVKREVTRIVTPGTNLNMASLEASKNNYLCCVYATPLAIGLSAMDVTTGDYAVTQVTDAKALLDEIVKFSPKEIICNDGVFLCGLDVEALRKTRGILVNAIDPSYFIEQACKDTLLRHFHSFSLSALGLDGFGVGSVCAGALLSYLYETQKNDLSHITGITPYLAENFMLLDVATRRNLELCETLREKQKRGSLLHVLDKTRTAMGGRLLRAYVEQPLTCAKEIEERLDAVEALCQDSVSRDELREYLNPVYDLERLLSKITYQTANARDLLAFRSSLEMLPAIRTLLHGFPQKALAQILDEMANLDDLFFLIRDAILEEPPLSIREGGLIKDGYSADVDKLRSAKKEGKTWLAALEEADRERTGIKNLKIKYNRVFGYYFDVTNSYKDLVPADYMRKQTLTGSERYTTPKLKELEDTILNAEEKLQGLEYDLFCEIREKIALQTAKIKATAKALAKLDVYASLSLVAERNRYVRPALNEDGIIEIKDGRHPVVEQMLENGLFIANDTYLDQNANMVSIITGPNMAGKSTYMRQCALIVLMAQIGSFVPASYANIGLVDRIFTRVGASDDLSSGQSTFMVEMNEVANILRNATKKSLLILDEIGRGTSTYDGLSIAWAVLEQIADTSKLGAKTLFATHYHELTRLEETMENVVNYCVAVKESGDDVIFLRKIIPGGADKSYGIAVARLAGVPGEVTARAKEILEEILQTAPKENALPAAQKKPDEALMSQETLTTAQADVLLRIKHLKTEMITPLEALHILYELKEKVK